MTQFTISADEYKELSYAISQCRYGDDLVEGLYPYYSGRGMFGNTCFGWVGDDIASVQLELAHLLVQKRWKEYGKLEADQDANDMIEELREVLDDIGSPTTDNMGRSVIHYWRGVQVEPGVKTEDDEDY
jgi:hypothetical protein